MNHKKLLLSSFSLLLLSSAQAFIKEVQSCTELEGLLNRKEPTLIYVYADWCTPCQSMASVINEVDRLHSHKILVSKVNYDNFKEPCKALGVDALPRMIFIRGGEKIVQKGGREKDKFLHDVQSFIAGTLKPEEETVRLVELAKEDFGPKSPPKKAPAKKPAVAKAK